MRFQRRTLAHPKLGHLGEHDDVVSATGEIDDDDFAGDAHRKDGKKRAKGKDRAARAATPAAGEDYYARVEGRDIIGNLAKAAGLATMIAAMRPDIDNVDEYVRNTTARAFAVVAQALGVPALLPFLKAVCQSKKSWQARHTGVKIVQQIAILMGCATLPHLRSMVEIIEHGLADENQKVRTITALSVAALAEAAAPYGIESFDSVLKPLWKGIRAHRGLSLIHI